jgi:chorismate-pyruvate lyase
MFAKLKKQRQVEHELSLVERHFVLQDERPGHLREIGIEALDTFLRNLLFTDGTVTRALGAQTLAAIAVERLGQSPIEMPAGVAECLEAEAGQEAIRRRVRIGIDAPPIPVLWAESFLVPERLPPGFLGLLDGAPDGIGQSLQRVSLESSRELCWYGLDSAPEWAEAGADAAEGTLHRRYRIVSAGKPAILISEHFAIERRFGVYHLAGVRAHEARQGQWESAG